MKGNTLEQLEQQELIKKLIDNGYGKLVEVFLTNESQVYTKKGRLNKCGACRILDCKPKELEELIDKCKELLEKDC